MRQLFAAGMLFAAGCLPDDVRPPPAEVTVVAESSPATREGFDTVDGWHIEFDVFALSLGQLGLTESDAGSCEPYSFTYYGWVHDYAHTTEPEKIGIVHGLGSCRLAFLSRPPDAATRFGDSVDPATLVGASAEDTIALAGSLTRDGVVKTFSWSLPLPLDFVKCLTPDLTPRSLDLISGEATTVTLTIRGEGILEQVLLDDNLWGDVLIELDEDGDGVIEEPAWLEMFNWTNEDGSVAFTTHRLSSVVSLEGGLCSVWAGNR